MQDRVELNLLLDYYGAFLTDNQRELIEMSCDDDYSLSEIAEQKSISRQGVRDAIARGSKTLADMESKLRLIERDRRAVSMIGRIRSELEPAARCGQEGVSKAITLLDRLSDIMEGKDGV